MSFETHAAVAKLYDVFVGYPLRPHVDGCPHCVDAEDHLRLSQAPLRLLSGEALGRFATKALTTWGTVEDFKHFLPRLFELLSEPSVPSTAAPDPEILLGKLRLAAWWEWPPAERSAVRSFLLAWWRDILTRYPDRNGAGLCLRAIGSAETDLTPFLDIWSADRGWPALLHLADLVLENRDALLQTGTLNRTGWFPGQKEQLRAWLLASEPKRRFEEAFFANSGAPGASRLAEAYDCLDWIARIAS